MFRNDLIVRRIIGVRNAWQLKEELVWKQDKKMPIVVPKDFIFDFASIPSFFQRIFPKNGQRYDRASCLHDWLYASQITSRGASDTLFYFAMRSDGVGKIKSWIFYQSVRLFGGFVWNKHTNEDVMKMRELMNKKEDK